MSKIINGEFILHRIIWNCVYHHRFKVEETLGHVGPN